MILNLPVSLNTLVNFGMREVSEPEKVALLERAKTDEEKMAVLNEFLKFSIVINRGVPYDNASVLIQTRG